MPIGGNRMGFGAKGAHPTKAKYKKPKRGTKTVSTGKRKKKRKKR